MGLTLPSVPDIAAGSVITADDLNAVGDAVTFLMNKPIAMIYDSAGGQSIGSSYPPSSDITFSGLYYDTDDMTGSNGAPWAGLTAYTPGWYKVRYMVTTNSAGNDVGCGVYQTTGPLNPAGEGVARGPFWGGYGKTGSTVGIRISGGGLFPLYFYKGDWVHIRAYNDGGTMTTYSTVPSFLSMEWVSA